MEKNTMVSHWREDYERYKFLKNSELSDIPDDVLEDAVMNWMWAKWQEEGLDQYLVIRSLPKPCQHVYSCRTVTDEINNGGLNQLFFNQTGAFAEMSIESFLALGSQKLSRVMEEAVGTFWLNRRDLEEYNDGTIESFCDSCKLDIFEELDSMFNKERDFIDIVKYIRQHADCFGD
jgi:hypothetical protein